jgi:hypothetical protein
MSAVLIAGTLAVNVIPPPEGRLKVPLGPLLAKRLVPPRSPALAPNV